MGLVQTTAPTFEPVTLNEAKAYMRVEAPDDDALITDLIAAATRWLEEETWRQIPTATWEWRFDRFPARSTDRITLPKPPLASVTSIQYVDPDGVVQTWSSSLYTVRTQAAMGQVYPIYQETYPDTRDEPDAVRIVFVAGQAAAAIRQDIKTAIKATTQAFYDFGGPMTTGSIVTEINWIKRVIHSLSMRHAAPVEH